MATLTCVRTKHNPEQTYEQFKEARLQGFGASDIGSLMNEGDYSCKRRLFLERLGLFPEEESRLQHHVERGKFLEGPVALLYESRTQRVCKPVGTAYIKEFPFMRANTDRLQFSPDKDWGCLEIKCPGEHMFRKIKKEGLPLAYILQLQWQMFCYGTTWGSFAIYWADGHELLTFDVQRDDELIESMQAQVSYSWGLLSGLRDKEVTLSMLLGSDPYFPGALDPHAKACERCPMFERCHGSTFEAGKSVRCDHLAGSAKEFVALKAEIKRLEKMEKDIKESFELTFREGTCDAIQAGGYVIQRSERSRESISPKVKEILTPEQAVTYIKQSEYSVITVKEAK